MLEIRNIKKSFGGIKALRNISLNLKKNKITGIIGPNGAGKTTLFNIITGYIKPDHGQILFSNGTDITGMSPSRIADLGIIRGFQNLRLFENLSVLDNVIIYSDQHSSEKISSALLPHFLTINEYEKIKANALEMIKLVGLEDKKENLALDLSFAEQKLLNLARLFAMKGDLLLLDEPMSGVDSKVIQKIIKFIKELPGMGKTVCVIEHSLDVIQSISDEVIFIGEGMILFQGDLEQVFVNKKLADMYLGV
jgi:ABC-type branched-subunit amino acid transport system ATPase component